jgi:hypothetical protein
LNIDVLVEGSDDDFVAMLEQQRVAFDTAGDVTNDNLLEPNGSS